MSPRSWKVRFSLWMLFILLTASTLGVAYWFRSGTHVAKVILRAPSRSSLLSGPPGWVLASRRSGGGKSITSMTVAAMEDSDYVMHDILRSPAVANLPLISSVDKPVDWLKDHVKVRPWPDSELVEIYMNCTASTTSQAQKIVEQVARSCVESMRASAMQENFTNCEALNTAAISLGNQIDELEGRLDKTSDSTESLRLEALKQTFIAVRRRRQELQVERTVIDPVFFLQPATTEIRKPFWK